MQRTEKTIEIHAPVERVFDLFSDFESFPRWMRNIKEVRYTGRRYTRWTADAPFGSSVEWEAETTHFEPDHRISWRTVRGDVDTEGEVIFEETRYGTTRLRVILGYDPPAGRLGALVAHLFGKDPEQQLEEDLERFADVVEGRMDKRRARDGYERSGRRGAREEYDARDMRRADGYRSRAYGARGYVDDDVGRERESRAPFDEALREARRSQLEGGRRYREERERDEQRRYLAARERDERGRDQRRSRPDEQRRERDDERERDQRGRDDDYRRRMSEPVPRPAEDERGSRSNRYPMTPREWERDVARRQPDYGYSREAFRRGVDKLMEEPPSSRWRRWE